MDEYIEKHLFDILNAATEVESYFADAPKRFQDFQNDMLRQRAVERNVEIMGEAINRILKHDPDFILPNSRAIVATRNRVNHGYDSVTTEFIWSLIIRHIPALKKDVKHCFLIINKTFSGSGHHAATLRHLPVRVANNQQRVQWTFAA